MYFLETDRIYLSRQGTLTIEKPGCCMTLAFGSPPALVGSSGQTSVNYLDDIC